MMRRWSWLLFAASALIALGCSNQGEGERCSRLAGNNGDDDCEPGLHCVTVGQLELCCPTDRTPSDPQCIEGLGTGGTGGAGGSAGSDADASTDAEQNAD